MTMNRHEPWDELVSASLTGDLSAEERARLDTHLDACAECRATLAAFSDQRRIVAGLRHLPAPRDLGARVRTGIEGGSRLGLPWWRRPTAIFAGVGGGLAVVAGALLAIVLLNGDPDPQVGDATPSPSASVVAASATPVPSTPAPSASPVESAPAPSAEATPVPTPIPASPQPELYLALTGPIDNQVVTLRHWATGETIAELASPASPPIAAELSPDGEWLAYISTLGESGMNEVRVARVAEGTGSAGQVGETLVIGESVAGSAFLEQMTWSADSRYLAFTLADAEARGTDVWVFESATGESWQLTATGDAYAGSWVDGPWVTVPDGDDAEAVWVSRAGEEVASYLTPLLDGTGGHFEAVDPASTNLATWDGVFQPLLSPNGSLALYWRGRMEQAGAEWLFAEGAAPYLAEHRFDTNGFSFSSERQLFSDLTIGREAFASAAITWGLDGDAYAVWGVQWTGTSQGPSGVLYPDEEQVYFGHATDARGLTRTHAIDAGDIPEGSRAVDVKVAGTGRHLVITAARPRAGVLDPPRADLLFVTRNTGDVPDEVVVQALAENGWFGPAAYARPPSEAP